MAEDTELRFRRFLQDVGSHWVELMSGGLVTVALGFIERLSGRNFPLYVYLCVVFFFILLACFRAWRDAQKRMLEGQRELEVERANPEIRGEIQEVYHTRTLQMGVPDEQKRMDHYLTIKVHLVNTRQRPTKIESFGLKVERDQGEYEAIITPLHALVLQS